MTNHDSNQKPVDLSIVMVTWNSLSVTAAALDSIRKFTNGIEYEVFLIDNGTTKDKTATEIPSQFPWVSFIANPDNQGFTRANNRGIQKSVGRYVLLLNNDTLQTENALAASVKYMDEHPEVGALGIKHLNHDTEHSFQPSFYPFPKPLQDILGLFGRKRPFQPPDRPMAIEQDVDWICGSYLMMRRECLEQVGILDERFFIYDEDIDWCLQAHRAGWKVRYWQGASMVHLGAASNLLMRDKTLVMFRSHVSYLRKNHGRLASMGFYFGMVIKLWLAYCKQLLRLATGQASREEVQQRWQRLMSFAMLRPGKLGG